jgi:hypothetical protein
MCSKKSLAPGQGRKVVGYTRNLRVNFHSNHGHPQSAGLHLPEGACFMSTMRVYTRKFRESAVGLVLSQCCLMVCRSA